jgi:SAM-dependent methyltransferase
MSAASPTDAVAFHSEISSDFHATYKTDPNRKERIAVWRNLIARYVTPGKLAYDLGCGSGMVTCEIAPFAERIIAIDGAAGMLDIARKTLAERDFRNVDFMQIRLPPPRGHGLQAGEIVISSSVIEYLDSVEDALAFVRDILKPGGILIFSVSNRICLKRRAVRIVHRFTGRPRYFGLLRHFLSVEEVEAKLRAAGLELLDSEYFDGKDRINSLVGLFLPKKYAANLIVAVARRPA